MENAYLEYAEIAFQMMAVFGVAMTAQEILDQTAKKLAGKHGLTEIASARAKVEAKLNCWNLAQIN